LIEALGSKSFQVLIKTELDEINIRRNRQYKHIHSWSTLMHSIIKLQAQREREREISDASVLWLLPKHAICG